MRETAATRTDSLGRTMKNYHALFINDKTTITLAIDGISETHAEARAWIKFMATQSFKEYDEDSWKLEALDLSR